jgi:tetratricopeptide (TPR) repeat protein
VSFDSCRRSVRIAAGIGALLLLGGCDRGDKGRQSATEALDSRLVAVPVPDLENADESVKVQHESTRSDLQDLLDQPQLDVAAAAQAYVDLGRIYLIYDFLEAAEVCFRNARTLEPDDFRWNYLLGYVAKMQGRLPEAIELLEAALEQQPESIPATLRLGRAELETGDYEAAASLFEQALKREEDSAAALEGLGKIAAIRGEHSLAAQYFERALEAAPVATSLHYALGQAYRNAGRLDEARKQLELSGDVAVPISDPLISPLAVLGESAQFYLVQGGEALNDKNYDVAAAAYERALEHESENFIAHKGLSYALEKRGDVAGAIEQMRVALEQGTTGDPEADRGERADILRVLGGLEVLRGDDDAAVDLFRQSLDLDLEQPGTRMKLANALARLGRLEDSITELDRLLESVPEHAPEILVKRATVLINLNRGKEALADFRRALALRPEDQRLRLRYADALAFLGDARGAEEQRTLVERAEGNDTTRAAVFIEMAEDLAKKGRYGEAVTKLGQALDLDSERVDALFLRASYLGHLERYEEAIESFGQVIEREPRHAAARRGEITALILTQHYGHARVRLNEAMRLFSLDAELAHLQARLLASVPDARVRDGGLALEVAGRLAQSVDSLRIRETMAMALAESGDSQRAAELQRALVAQAEESGEEALVADLRRKLAAFESGKAWWATSPEEILNTTLGGL